MSYGPGDGVIFDKGLFNAGATSPADVLPTAVVLRNGTADNAVTVTTTYTNPLYRFAFTIPSGYAVNDLVELRVSATVGMISATDVLWRQRLTTDSAVLGEIVDTLGTPGTSVADELNQILVIIGHGGNPIAIDQNTGGTDNLRYVDGAGNGIPGGRIRLYLVTDWPNNSGNVQGQTTSGNDGRWATPIFVSSGTYIAVFDKAGNYETSVSAAITV